VPELGTNTVQVLDAAKTRRYLVAKQPRKRHAPTVYITSWLEKGALPVVPPNTYKFPL
jgi:hypothetical protein